MNEIENISDQLDDYMEFEEKYKKYRALMPIEKIIEWLSEINCKEGAMFSIEYYTIDGEYHTIKIFDKSENRIGLINYLIEHEIAVTKIERVY